MSTFDGVVLEFPEIRIDYFRAIPGRAPPLACFLSHVHSDHLYGLESLKAPFVYCSPTTRQLLLPLEKYPSRMNFAKGILETRVQTYRHLARLLKAIPLETPTAIELYPGKDLRVTLFDANHCPGAVMFLIQGESKAILYTGDIRAETWWVNSLVRNPVLLPYTLGSRCIDTIYLDTTFATRSEAFRQFPSKAEGILELLKKVERYPLDTNFHFQSWTFGYEEVWIALSEFLKAPVHLDTYRWSLYQSLNQNGDAPGCREAPPLCGFMLGNHEISGCLTRDENVRLHSCESGHSCPVFRPEYATRTVKIIPIVTRTKDGIEIAEVGAVGGKGDLDQPQELDIRDPHATHQLLQLCEKKLSSQSPALLARVISLISKASVSRYTSITLRGCLDAFRNDPDKSEGLPLLELVDVLVDIAKRGVQGQPTQALTRLCDTDDANSLPKVITFPYSRHSSYSELCNLVSAFHPKDIHPCTIDVADWTPAMSMRSFFGAFCSGESFRHDALMLALYEEKQGALQETDTPHVDCETQHSETDTDSDMSQKIIEISTSKSQSIPLPPLPAANEADAARNAVPGDLNQSSLEAANHTSQIDICSNLVSDAQIPPEEATGRGSTGPQVIAVAPPSCSDSAAERPRPPSTAQLAYVAALGTRGFTWAEFGGLVSAGNNNSEEEMEL